MHAPAAPQPADRVRFVFVVLGGQAAVARRGAAEQHGLQRAVGHVGSLGRPRTHRAHLLLVLATVVVVMVMVGVVVAPGAVGGGHERHGGAPALVARRRGRGHGQAVRSGGCSRRQLQHLAGVAGEAAPRRRQRGRPVVVAARGRSRRQGGGAGGERGLRGWRRRRRGPYGCGRRLRQGDLPVLQGVPPQAAAAAAATAAAAGGHVVVVALVVAPPPGRGVWPWKAARSRCTASAAVEPFMARPRHVDNQPLQSRGHRPHAVLETGAAARRPGDRQQPHRH